MKNLRFLIFMGSVLFAISIFAQTSNANYPNYVSVTGVGKVKVIPDRVTIKIGVESKNEVAKKAKLENDKNISEIISIIKKFGIDNKNFQTERVSLYQRSNYVSETQKEVKFYVANQSISILLEDIKIYEDFMLALLEAGTNRIENISFSTSNSAKYKQEARKLAIENAKLKANDYATALGQKVGDAISVSESNSNFGFINQNFMASSPEVALDGIGVSETIAIGELEIEVNINASFYLLH